MGQKCLRAVVSEGEYGVTAEVPKTEFWSDEVATGMRISEHLRARGRESQVMVGERQDGVAVHVALGDASDHEFEVASQDMKEAASW